MSYLFGDALDEYMRNTYWQDVEAAGGIEEARQAREDSIHLQAPLTAEEVYEQESEPEDPTATAQNAQVQNVNRTERNIPINQQNTNIESNNPRNLNVRGGGKKKKSRKTKKHRKSKHRKTRAKTNRKAHYTLE